MAYSKQDILDIVERDQIKLIWLWFVDVEGILKGFGITDDELENALNDGMGFDGSSISGFNAIEESDLVAVPDISTFSTLPWEDPSRKSCRMICDIVDPAAKQPYNRDSRHLLKTVLKKAEALGFTCYVGPELEYFYFKNEEGTEFIDSGGYFSAPPLDLGNELRKKTIDALNGMGIPVEYHHHEVAPSQHEIKEVARMNDCYATFMPKPVFGENGSGMHVHMSLFNGDQNAFFNPDCEDHLSSVAKHFMAGVLHFAPEITAFLAQWVNSYKRLVPGFEAPVYIAWSRQNRSALVRVPGYQPGKEKATRIELRCPDPACNPYLAFAAILGAGLKGIEEEMEPPEEQKMNLYHLTKLERVEMGIKNLPENLHEALHFVKKSKLLPEIFGADLVENFLALKYEEYNDYRIQVSKWELDNYLSVL